MPLAIVLRRDAAENAFRQLMLDVLDSGHVREALICSGFFQENFKGSACQASLEGGLAAICAARSIELTTVGIHNGTWKPSYRNFQANMLARGVNINCLYKNRLAWHANIFIASDDHAPIIGIIGS